MTPVKNPPRNKASRRQFLKRATVALAGAGCAAWSKGAGLASPRSPAAPQAKRTADTVEDRVKRLIIAELDVDEAQVVPKARLREDLDADSLDVVELVMALEEAFEIEISEQQSEKLRTVEDVIHCVQDQVKIKEPAAGKPSKPSAKAMTLEGAGRVSPEAHTIPS